jgi:hypothetical protein
VRGDEKKKTNVPRWRRMNWSNILAGWGIIGSVLHGAYVFLGKAILMGFNVLWKTVKGFAVSLYKNKPEDKEKGVFSYFVRSDDKIPLLERRVSGRGV